MVENLTEKPVKSILVSLSLPMIWGMFAVTISAAADSYFLGKLGTPELAAIGMITPISFIFGSISIGLGVAVSSLVSRAIGEKNFHKVQRLTTDSLFLALLLLFFFIVVGLLTIDPLFSAMGAGPEILPRIKEYMIIYYPGTLFLVIPMVGNGAIRATGNTIFPALIMSITAITNILLNPILIFGYGPIPALGMEGAAISSVIARAVTMCWSLLILHFKYGMIDFKFVGFKNTIESFKKILKLSLPSTLTNLVVPVSIAIITGVVTRFGTDVTAGFGVAGRIESLFFIILYGIGAGTSAFFGQNWGAKKYVRVTEGISLTTKFAFIYGICAMIFFFIFGKDLALLFSEKESVYKITTLYLLIVSPSYAFEGIRLINSNAMAAIGRPLYPTLIMSFRMFFLYVPLALFAAKYLGVSGVFVACALANVLAGSVALYLNFRFIPKLMT